VGVAAEQQQRLTDGDDADMLFTGDGEAFNVRLCLLLPLAQELDG
jgi:hypothetical protein